MPRTHLKNQGIRRQVSWEVSGFNPWKLGSFAENGWKEQEKIYPLYFDTKRPSLCPHWAMEKTYKYNISD